MSVVVITPPSPVVTFEEVEKHLADVPAEDQTYVEGLIAAATAWIDGPAGWLGRAIGVQLLEWQLSAWPCNGRWPIPNMLEVESVSYVDSAGVDQTWPLPDPVWFASMPAVRGRPGDIRIRYWAGYGKREGDPAAWANVTPAAIKVAIMMLVAQWYHNRSSVTIGGASGVLPNTVNDLLSPYRVWRV